MEVPRFLRFLDLAHYILGIPRGEALPSCAYSVALGCNPIMQVSEFVLLVLGLHVISLVGARADHFNPCT